MEAEVTSPYIRLEFVDALRGWSALAVLLVHSEFLAPPPKVLLPLVHAGARGVQLFFIISAFTMFYTLSSRGSLKSFFIRRIFRIAPLFYVVLFLSLAMGNAAPGRYWAPDGTSLAGVLLTGLFLNGWHPALFTGLVDGGWTIAVEMNFYLLVPVLFRYIRGVWAALLCVPVSYFVGKRIADIMVYGYKIFLSKEHFYLADSWHWMGLPWSMYVFLCGIFSFYVWRDWPWLLRAFSARTYSKILYFLIFSLVCVVYVYPNMAVTVFLLAGIFLVSSACDSRLIHSKIMMFMGKISYSTYLLHFFVIRWIGGAKLPWLVYFCVLVIVTCVVSYIAYRLIELPGQHVGRSFASFFNERESNAVKHVSNV